MSKDNRTVLWTAGHHDERGDTLFLPLSGLHSFLAGQYKGNSLPLWESPWLDNATHPFIQQPVVLMWR